MSSLIVEVPQGKLKGRENASILNKSTYYSFLGIPYAKPPVGDLRFKAPEPSEKWAGIYDATYERDGCAQKDLFAPFELTGSENCLYLSIDTPQLPHTITVPKPVMVWIHGGGFACGEGSQKYYSSDYLITHDVILVRVNYRLHVLGFLNLDLPECPGNVGLKDQTLALKWVKDNVQVISPLAKGLFNKAIIQSGTAFSPWAFSHDHESVAIQFGKQIGFTGNTKEELLAFLKQQSYSELAIKAAEMTIDIMKKYPGKYILTPFMPSVEAFKDGACLPESPENLSKTADPLPIIYGLTDKEGFIAYCIESSEVRELFTKDVEILLKNNFNINPNDLPKIGAKIKKHYFGDKEISAEHMDEITDMFSDFYFYKLYEAIEFVIKSSTPPFVYEFCYGGGLNMIKRAFAPLVKKNIDGAVHGDDIGYLFHTPKNIPEPLLTGDDLTVIENITKLWTNFAKTGIPTDESVWAPSTSSKPCYLKIDRCLQLKEGKVYGERLQFLKDLLDPVVKF